MSEPLGDAVLDLRTDQRSFDRGIDSAERRVQGLDAQFKQVGQNLSGFGDKMTTRVSLPLAAVGAAAFKMASDAEENANKFNVVMGEAASAVRARLEELTATIPLTRSEMEGLSAGIQDMLVPLGLARAGAADMSANFVELAGDIGSFSNVPVAQVLDDIKSALAGSSEPMRKYGIDTRIAQLETVALEAGLIKAGEKMDAAATAQAVLIQVTRQSADAIGDAARTTDSAANSTKFFWRDIKDLSITIGQDLIPAITPLINDLRGVLGWLKELSPETRQWALRVAAVAIAAGPVLSITGRLASVSGSLLNVTRAITIATGLRTAATLADTAATAANTAAQAANTAAVGGFIPTQAAATAATTAGTAAAGANAAKVGLLSSALGKAGLVGAVAVASVAVGTLANKYIIGTQALADFAQWAGIIPPRVELTAVELENQARRTDEVTTATRKLIPLTESFIDFEKRMATEARAAAEAIEKEQLEAIKSLGFTIETDLLGQLDQLNTALASGKVPVEQLTPKVRDLIQEWKDKGLIDGDIEDAIDGIIDKIRAQGGIIEQLIGAQDDAFIAATNWADAIGDLPGALDDSSFAQARALATTLGLTEAQATAILQFSDTGEEAAILAAKLDGDYGPAIQAATERMLGLDEALQENMGSLGGFLDGITKGIPALDGFLGSLGGLTGGIFDFFKGLLGGGGAGGGGIGGLITGLFSSLGGEGGGGFLNGLKTILGGGAGGATGGGIGEIFGNLFGGGFINNLFQGAGGGAGGSFLSGLLGAFGSGAGGLQSGLVGLVSAGLNFIPVIGPFLAKFAGPLLSGLKAIGGKVLGFFKGLFGGPSAAEIAGREAAAGFRDAVRAELSDEVLAQVRLQFPGDIQNASFLASIQQMLIASGVAAEKAGAQARMWGTRLFEAEKQGADAVAAVIAQINAATQAAKDGIDAVNDIATTSTTLMERRLDKVTERIKAAGLTAEQEAIRIERATQRIADRIAARNGAAGTIERGFMAMSDSISDSMDKAGTDSEKAARKTARAMERAARQAKRQLDRIADDSLASTTATAGHFNDLADSIQQAFGEMEFDIPITATDQRDNSNGRRGNKDITKLAHGGIVTRPTVAMIGESGPEAVIPLGKKGGGRSVGTLTLNIDADGVGRLATKVVTLTPEILRQLGIG